MQKDGATTGQKQDGCAVLIRLRLVGGSAMRTIRCGYGPEAHADLDHEYLAPETAADLWRIWPTGGAR